MSDTLYELPTGEPETIKKYTLPLVVKGVKKLSDAQFKEQTRHYIPSAIDRLAALCNSNNEAISLGAIKVLLNKNLPDLKATDITTLGKELPVPLLSGINVHSDNSSTEAKQS